MVTFFSPASRGNAPARSWRARWLATIATDDAVARTSSSADPSALAAARQIVRDARSTTGWLDPGHTFELISTAGVPGLSE